MASPIKIGVVGCGVGRLHLAGYQALGNEVEIVAVGDKNEAKACQAFASFIYRGTV